MEKLISYPISVVFYLCFGLFLCIFHPIQWVCFNVFGYQAHKKSVDYLNFFLVRCTNLLGTTYTFKNRKLIPEDVPIIFVANHQSLYDIVGIIWYLRNFCCWKYFICFSSLVLSIWGVMGKINTENKNATANAW